MPRQKKYTEQLREQAVRLVVESGRSVAQTAGDLGIDYESLRRWVRQAEADAGERTDLLATSERKRLMALERENSELRQTNEILKAASDFFRRSARPKPTEVSAFIDVNRSDFGVEPICRILGVSASAYYRRANDGRSRRAVEDDRLIGLIKELHLQSHEEYGYRGMWEALRSQGETVGRNRVYRLMRRSGILGSRRGGSPPRPGQA